MEQEQWFHGKHQAGARPGPEVQCNHVKVHVHKWSARAQAGARPYVRPRPLSCSCWGGGSSSWSSSEFSSEPCTGLSMSGVITSMSAVPQRGRDKLNEWQHFTHKHIFTWGKTEQQLLNSIENWVPRYCNIELHDALNVVLWESGELTRQYRTNTSAELWMIRKNQGGRYKV